MVGANYQPEVYFLHEQGGSGDQTNELGQFFTIRTSNSSSVPMLLQQRLDEIHFKGTERPINQTIYREFNGISVLWDPIYAPVDLERHPYGTVLIPESTLETTGGTFGEMFLTSRGMISIPINDPPDNGYYWHDRSVRNYRRNSQKV